MAFLSSKISRYGSGIKLSLNNLWVKVFDEFSICECPSWLYWCLSSAIIMTWSNIIVVVKSFHLQRNIVQPLIDLVILSSVNR
jgi:hypothetical protein